MKYKIAICLFLCTGVAAVAEAQLLERLGNRVKRKVTERIERKTDEIVERGLDKVEESTTGNRNDEHEANPAKPDSKRGDSSATAPATTAGHGTATTFSVYSKYDFIPGGEILFYDDFAVDRLGDFPAKWNTNASGEVVELGANGHTYFKLTGGALYLPAVGAPLPADYTIEFDLKFTGLDEQISSTAYLDIILDESATFQQGHHHAIASLSFCQFTSNGLPLASYGSSIGTIQNTIDEDYRKVMAAGPHISIAVNGTRFRLWMNERKMVDVPTFIPPDASHLKLALRGFDTDYKRLNVLIGNVKIAGGGTDFRSALLQHGQWATNGILFDVNSARVRPESYGVLKEIADALQQNPAINVQIIGHTDADGAEAPNLKLSQDRAAAVKTLLVQEFGIAAERMETGGKGESEPVAANDSTEGKAKNRRVEFIRS